MTAGDCLYIPFKWIHQVRSYERNIAVNLWLDHLAVIDVDPSLCEVSSFGSTDVGVWFHLTLSPRAVPDLNVYCRPGFCFRFRV